MLLGLRPRSAKDADTGIPRLNGFVGQVLVNIDLGAEVWYHARSRDCARVM
jgi:hypothetical protein